jgi:hypothetical protein
MAHTFARSAASSYAAASAPPLDRSDDADDDSEAIDHALALELQRFYECQHEQEVEDETVAYSLVLDEARHLHDGHEDEDFDFVEVSMMTGGKPPPHCSCCLIELPRAAQRRVLPCGHVYCVSCIATRARMGVRDRSLVPAHCCKKEFPNEYIKEVLSLAEWATYERFVDEHAWTSSGELVSDAEYAAAVKQHGWKQCPRCGVGVEKVSGCDAMRCLRGHLFCWACAQAPCQCGLTNLATYGYRG